jgi:hypothetical protein
LFATLSQLATKQDTLVSGTNIKTVNSTSLLGSGDIPIPIFNPSGVAGSIQFSDGSAFASDSNLFWDNTNKRLGVGTNTPSKQITISTSTVNGGIYTEGGINAGFYVGNYTNGETFVTNNGLFHTVFTRGGNVGIGTGTFSNPNANDARLKVKGSGATSATTALLVQNSAGNTSLQLTDDGRLNLPLTGVGSRSIIVGGNYIGFRGDSNKLIGIEADGFLYFDGGNRFKVDPSGNALVYGELNMNSTTKGFLPPRMTTTQKNAIASPAAGLQVYDTTLNQMSYYNGSSWINF